MRSDTYIDIYAGDLGMPSQAITTQCIASVDIACDLEDGFPWSRVRRLGKKA